MKTEYWIFFPDVAAIRFWTSKSLFTFQSSKRIRETFLEWVLYNKSLAAICLLKKKSAAAVGTSHRICYRRWIAAIRKRVWIRKQFVYLRWMKPGHSEKAGCAGNLRASRSASSLIPNSIFYFFIDTPWCQKNWGAVWNVNKQLFLFDTYSMYLTFHLLDFIDFLWIFACSEFGPGATKDSFLQSIMIWNERGIFERLSRGFYTWCSLMFAHLLHNFTLNAQ